MTREEQILEYANSFKGKGMESEELKEIIRLAIIDGAKWADNHPMKPSLPSNLDEAARLYAIPHYMKELNKDYLDEYPYDPGLEAAFKAGAKWMAGLGENKEGEVLDHDEFIKFSDGTYIDLDPTQGLIPAFKIKDGDKVVVQIRKINEKEK